MMLYNLKVTELKTKTAGRISDWLRSQSIQNYNVLVSKSIKLKLTLWCMIVSQIKIFKDDLKKIDITLKNE